MWARASLRAAPSVARRVRSVVRARMAVSQRSGVSARVGSAAKQGAIAVQPNACSGGGAPWESASPQTSRAQGSAMSRSRA